MAEPGGRAVERKIALPVTPSGNMIGVKPLFSGRSLADGASADVRRGRRRARRQRRWRSAACTTSCCASRPIISIYKRDGSWNFEPVKTTTRVADGTIDTAPDKPARISLPVNFGRYRLEVSSGRCRTAR